MTVLRLVPKKKGSISSHVIFQRSRLVVSGENTWTKGESDSRAVGGPPAAARLAAGRLAVGLLGLSPPDGGNATAPG